MAAEESVGEFVERPSGVDLEGASNVLVLTGSLDDTVSTRTFDAPSRSTPLGRSTNSPTDSSAAMIFATGISV